MDKETALKILRELHDKALFSERTALETLHPELKESEDEGIKKALVRFHKSSIDIDGIKREDILAWLEKQGDTSEIVNKKKIASDILRGAAINLITWIDYNAAEGNMCLSNMECKDIEDALVSGDWDKIYAYIKKKLEKQGEQKPMTEEFEHELAEICNQLLSEIDSEWMNNEILDCIGTSVWLNLCDETAKRYKDGLLKLAKQGEQNPAWSEDDSFRTETLISVIKSGGSIRPELRNEFVNWLKSLKDRIGG